MHKIHFTRTLLLSSLMAATLLSTPVAAQNKREKIASFKDWDTFKITNTKGNKQCYMISTPTRKRPVEAVRGNIYLTITHVPHLKRMNEVNTIIGYPFKPKSEATMQVGGKRYKMFTSGDGAWLSTPKQDLQIVNIMKKGNSVIIRGTSKRGTRTADTYSLMGFTAAYNAITKACK